MNGHSLRTRLLVTLLLATACIWSIACVISYQKALHEAGELLDGQLSQSSKLLLAQAEHEEYTSTEDEDNIEEYFTGRANHPYEQPLAFQIWDAQGNLLLKSTNAPARAFSRLDGYQDIRHEGAPWRMFARWSGDRRFQVQVAEPIASREQAALEVAMQVGLPIVLALPLLALLIIWAVGHALRPLDTLANSVATRTASNLTPINDVGLPREIQSMASALNSLLLRLNRALEGERRFTADAAHELRTPLAAIQVQAQVALASQDEEGRTHALKQVYAGTRRATHLIKQLLRLARLDPLAGLPNTHPINLATLTHQTLAEMSNKTLSRRVSVQDSVNAPISGDPDLLCIALRNLIDNALHYSPADSPVTVHITQAGDTTQIIVEDSGPGVAPSELSRLGERFYRGRETLRSGSGLGLAIVNRIAQLHGATLHLKNRPEGGFQASLMWFQTKAA